MFVNFQKLTNFNFKAKFQNDSVHYGLGYSSSTNFTTKLFVGAVYDSYQMSIYAQVYDDDGAYVFYNFPQPIKVLPDLSNLQTTMNKLIAKDQFFTSNTILNQGLFLLSLQEIQSISSLLNEQSLADKYAIYLNNSMTLLFPQTYGSLSSYSGVTPVRNFHF
jgi:hypothetical protein